MRAAAALLIGEHDFSVLPRRRVPGAVAGEDAARASRSSRRGAYWRFDFDANAFLHHMVRNLMGCLLAVGSGRRAPAGWPRCWPRAAATRRRPTFAADGLYFVGPYYDARHGHSRTHAGHGLAALSD